MEIEKSKLVEEMLKFQQSFSEDLDLGMGEPTEFKCHCGGIMYHFDPTRSNFESLKREVGRPRYSRRKRQAKKNLKKWRESQGFKTFLLAALARPLRNPMGYRCASCGRREGFYSMMAKVMFKIEPMPSPPPGVFYYSNEERTNHVQPHERFYRCPIRRTQHRKGLR